MKDLVKNTRGTVHLYKDDSFEFTPYGKGEPVYEDSYKVGEASIGKTKGKGKQSYVAKLKCDANEPDPREVMHTQLDKLAAKIWPPTALPPMPRGKVLLKEQGAIVAVNSKTGRLSLHLDIELSESCDYAKKVINFLTETNRCLFINQDLLTRVARATAKHSRQ